MKFIIRAKNGSVIRSYNNPLNHNIQDFLIKPDAKILKIIYNDGNIEIFGLVNRRYWIETDLQTDVEEFHAEYFVEESGN